MRAGSLTCPTCGSSSIQDRVTGEKVPWLVRQESGTRRPLASAFIAGGVLLFGLGLFFALLGFIADLGWYALVFAVVWGLLLARIGVGVVRQGSEGLSQEPTAFACLTCQTTWDAGLPPTAGPPTIPFDPGAASPPATPPGAVIPRQVRADAADHVTGEGGVHTPDIDEWVATILDSLHREPTDAMEAAEQEQARIDTVRIIAQRGQRERSSGRGDGRAAVAALVRLLDVDTGYLPELKVGHMHRTMRHEVIDLLGRSGDPAAIEPLLNALSDERAHYTAAVQQATNTVPPGGDVTPLEHPLRHSALADDLYRATVEALGRLGDARALPALQEAESAVQLGMRKATSKAIHAIEERQPH